MNRIFGTKVINLDAVKDFEFSIPTYQRPYVWGYDQIVTLLKDFHLAFTQLKTSKYYIGTILTKEVSSEPIELIDGQQRFTTLWLIAYAFKRLNIDTKLTQFLWFEENKLRIGFEIRKEVERYLNELLIHSNESIENIDPELKNQAFIKHIAEAITTIENFLESVEQSSEFGDYIYEQVYLVKNNTPEKIDLNKLFTTINSSGLQLEQTDIIKSKLLKKLGNEKVLYSKLWETVENMSSFFEKNVRLSFGTDVFKKMDLTKVIPFKDFRGYIDQKFENEDDLDNKGYTLSEIIATAEIDDVSDIEIETEENRVSEEVDCRSLINFSQFLIHVYRIHLVNEGKVDFEGTFHANRVIEIFDPLLNADTAEIVRFLELLWIARQCFDLNVLKWITDLNSKSESLELVNFNRNSDGYYSKTNYAIDNYHQLQSMLYFTGDYLRQYWLSPFLQFIIHHHEGKQEILTRLEWIDNTLSTSKLTDKETTWLMLNDMSIPTDLDIKDYLSESNGVKFKHYWFQKLEYVLYKNWGNIGENVQDNKYKNYRITSKNSVEHLNPQHPKTGDAMEYDLLNSFGNLVLLSVTQNSEYSNKYLDVKAAEFFNKPNYDTLKSKLAFSEENFTKEEFILKHQNEMINLLINHYNN